MPEASLTTAVDDRIISRWMSIEYGGIHKTIVVNKGTLAELLAEDEPARPTRGGEPHPFDREVLRRLDEDLASPWLRRRLQLPVSFYLDKDLPGQAYVQDAAAADALRRLGRSRTEPREGKLFMSEPLAREFALQYPTAAQFVIL